MAVIVFGASGFTGRLTVAELVRRGESVVLAGRSVERLQALARRLNLPSDTPVVAADPTKPDTLIGLFAHRQVDERPILINCVGPFTKLGEPVVKAAIAAGAHYLDITGEQRFIAHVIDRYHVRAIEAGCTVVPGCGVEYALTNWAAAQAAEGLEPLYSIDTGTQIVGVRPSRGTTLSLLAAIGTPGLGWRDGRRVVRMAGSDSRTLPFPDGSHSVTLAPFGDPITLPRHIDSRTISSWVVVPPAVALGLRATFPLVPVVGDVLSFALGGFIRRGKDDPEAAHNPTERWSVVAIATGPEGSRQVSLSGGDVYGLTAKILAYCAARMHAGDISKSGALGPAHAFDSHAALNFLQQDAGVTVAVA